MHPPQKKRFTSKRARERLPQERDFILKTQTSLSSLSRSKHHDAMRQRIAHGFPFTFEDFRTDEAQLPEERTASLIMLRKPKLFEVTT